ASFAEGEGSGLLLRGLLGGGGVLDDLGVSLGGLLDDRLGGLLSLGSGLLRSLLGLADDSLLGAHGLGDELDDRHGGVVALARRDLDDAGVATLTLRHLRRDLGEQDVDDALVRDRAQDATTVVEV